MQPRTPKQKSRIFLFIVFSIFILVDAWAIKSILDANAAIRQAEQLLNETFTLQARTAPDRVDLNLDANAYEKFQYYMGNVEGVHELLRQPETGALFQDIFAKPRIAELFEEFYALNQTEYIITKVEDSDSATNSMTYSEAYREQKKRDQTRWNRQHELMQLFVDEVRKETGYDLEGMDEILATSTRPLIEAEPDTSQQVD